METATKLQKYPPCVHILCFLLNIPKLASKAEIFINNLINRPRTEQQRVGTACQKTKFAWRGVGWLVGWLVVRQLKCLIAAANVEKTVITVIHCRCPIVSSVLTDDGRQRHPTRVCSQPSFFCSQLIKFFKF